MKKITTKYLEKINACQEGVDWVKKYKNKETIAVLEHLIKDKKPDWANWLISRVLNRKQKIQYAVFAAEQVIDIYEKKYLGDKRPRNAIEAAKKCIENPSAKNKKASADASAYAADACAYAAAFSADACDIVSYASASSAYAAVAYAADASASASGASASSAYAASASASAASAFSASADACDIVSYAYDAACDADKKKKPLLKILKYGIKLIK